ncbi:MAG: glutaredoxin family protein [Deltaproteobacteria bacterium]|nr:glutaredoxin family protein [Deltaproteobacteria bacterium]
MRRTSRLGHRSRWGWLALASVLSWALAASPANAARCERIEVWSRAGCPHCEEARRFLADLRRLQPGIEVVVHDVEHERDALDSLRALAARERFAGVSVPTFAMCGTVWVGFDDAITTGRRIEALVAGLDDERSEDTGVDVIGLGRVRVEDLGLPLFTVVLGLVDGFNPCAMWVLLFLLSILVNLRDRRRIVLIAGTFVMVSGLAYFAFMAAWLNVFLLVGLSRAVQVALGVIALAIGTIHVKDAVAFGRGPSLSIPEAAKPGIYTRVRKIVNAEALGPALAGAFVLAVLVNVVELLCTAGLPALYTQILGLQALDPLARYAYLVLYNVAYVADDTLMVALVTITLSRRKLDTTGGRWLKLVSGLVVLVLGILLLAAPERLRW